MLLRLLRNLLLYIIQDLEGAEAMRRFYRKLWGVTLATTLSGVIFFAPVASAATVHKVRPGESLWTIARQNHMDVETLAKLNGIRNTEMIKVGTELKLTADVSPAKLTPKTYTVRSGESLWTIARKYNMHVDTLAKINGISNTEMIKAGTKLLLEAAPRKYQVKPGESLWSIAQKFGVEYQDLIKYNQLRNPDQIRMGTQIMIPPVETGNLARKSVATSRTSQVTQSKFIWPVRGRISSPFGPRWGRMHEGIDIAIPIGNSVHAAADGKVAYGGWINGYGWAVIIDHGGGYRTLYGHNSKVLVTGGDRVKQGQVIAKSGNTGRSTGPHVHFEVQKNGRPVDPMSYLR